MKIDFYILEGASAQKSLHFCCTLLEKAYVNEQRVYIQVNSNMDAERLDTLLWTYREDSFLPHNVYTSTDKNPPPLQIISQEMPIGHRETLFNLSKEIPRDYDQFKQLIEIIYSDPEHQQLARERYKHYRDAGHDINTYKLKA